MYQVVAIAAAAGFASAFLFGVVTPGMSLLVPLTFIAPAPLFFVGIGWHPLVAALGTLLAAIGISLTVGSKVALSYVVMVGLPAYLLSEILVRLMRAMPPQTPQAVAGRALGLFVLGGIALYAASAVLVGALAVDFSYAGFEQRLSQTFERMLTQISSRDGPADTETVKQLNRMFMQAFVPLSSIMIATILTVSLWLSVKFLRKAERLPFAWFPAYSISLSRDAAVVLAGAAVLAQFSGFFGLYGSAMLGALIFIFALNGLALIHQRTLGSSSRTAILSLTWVLMFIFAPTALLVAILGLADAVFGLRSAPSSTDTIH